MTASEKKAMSVWSFSLKLLDSFSKTKRLAASMYFTNTVSFANYRMQQRELLSVRERSLHHVLLLYAATYKKPIIITTLWASLSVSVCVWHTCTKYLPPATQSPSPMGYWYATGRTSVDHRHLTLLCQNGISVLCLELHSCTLCMHLLCQDNGYRLCTYSLFCQLHTGNDFRVIVPPRSFWSNNQGRWLARSGSL